jgi:hypothetical protein
MTSQEARGSTPLPGLTGSMKKKVPELVPGILGVGIESRRTRDEKDITVVRGFPTSGTDFLFPVTDVFTTYCTSR